MQSRGPQPFWHQGLFHGRKVFHELERWGMVVADSNVLHLLFTYLYYYYISSTSDHQA